MTPAIALTLALLAPVLTWLLCRHGMAIGMALGVMDHPDPVGGRKRHDHATPLVGGLAILAPILLVLALQLAINDALSAEQADNLMWIGLTTVVMLVVGTIDDRYELPARTRLLTAVATLIVALLMAPELALTFLHFSLLDRMIAPDGMVAILFTLLCLVGFTNAINMADGKNGLVIGMCLIWTLLLSAFAPAGLLPVVLALAASLAVTLCFNLRGRLFLGDAGSYGLATLVGLLVIYVYKVNFIALPADVVAVWFAVPVLDCLRLLAWRMMRGLSPFHGGRDHLHHYLHASWPSWSRGLAVYMALVAIPSIIAALRPSLAPLCLAGVPLAYGALLAFTTRRLMISRPV